MQPDLLKIFIWEQDILIHLSPFQLYWISSFVHKDTKTFSFMMQISGFNCYILP